MTGDDIMDMWGFLKRRRTLGYTQEEAANKLGVSRGTIQHWERGVTRVPRIVDLSCEELTRRWKQQSDFGPVSLVYADSSMPQKPNDASRFALLQSEPSFANPIIMDQGGGVICTTLELIRECERRDVTVRVEGNPPQARAGPILKQTSPTWPTPRRSAGRDRPIE